MDPLADFLTQLKNAQAVGKKTVRTPYSKQKEALAKILKRQGFIGGVTRKGRMPKMKLELTLKYKDGIPFIHGVTKISKPGQKVYVSSSEIRPVKHGYGIAVISTSQGLMTAREAKKKHIGGELLCEVW